MKYHCRSVSLGAVTRGALLLLIACLARPATAQDNTISPSDISDIVQLAQCPGTTAYDDCYYPATPNGTQCRAGYFCLTPDSQEQCTPGFYCPANAQQPIFCLPRYYCSNDTKVITRCPEGYQCPPGTVDPIPCLLGSCPAGTRRASKTYLFAVFAVLALVCTYAFSRKHHYDRLRAIKHKEQIYQLVTDTAAADDADDGAATGGRRRGPDGAQYRNTIISIAGSDSPRSRASTLPRAGGRHSVIGDSRPVRQFSIEFTDLGLTLPGGLSLMKNVSGRLAPGRACAIMGPSGAGKTTFISLLMGKVKRTSGRILVNGVEEELSKYRRLIGFVPQDDIMLRELTVRDVLMHSARMRLPREWSYDRVKRHVLSLITFLGLTNVMDNVIGDYETVGAAISGGQRKRVNMALEAVADPSILFLDEPTSGLDSSTAVEVCRMLRRLANERGMLVAAVVHSPSPSAFRQFDDLVLLGKTGQLVYFGPRDEAQAYLRSCGFDCPVDENPADFFMDVTMGKVRSAIDPSFKPADLYEYWARKCAGKTPIPRVKSMVVSKQVGFKAIDNLHNPDAQENAFQEIRQEAMEYYLRAQSTAGGGSSDKKSTVSSMVSRRSRNERPRGCTAVLLQNSAIVSSAMASSIAWVWDVACELGRTLYGTFFFLCKGKDPVRETPPARIKFVILLKRACLQIYRNRNAFMLDQTLHLLCGLFISIGVQNFDYLSRQPESICSVAPAMLQQGCRQPMDLIRFTAIFISFGIIFAGISAGSNTFGRERAVYWRDTSAGMSTTAYFVTKWIADIPRVIIASLMFSLAFILFVSYRTTFEALYLIILLLYFNALAMGYFLSAFLRKEAVALAGTGFTLLWALALSGVVPELKDVNQNFGPLAHLWDLSAPRWAVEAIWIKEVSARPFIEDDPAPYSYDWDNYWPCCIRLAVIAAGWNFLAFLGLKLCNRRKMK